MTKKSQLVMLALAALLLNACVVTPAGRPYYRESVIVTRPQPVPHYFVAPPPRWERESSHGRLHGGQWTPRSEQRKPHDGRRSDHRGRYD